MLSSIDEPRLSLVELTTDFFNKTLIKIWVTFSFMIACHDIKVNDFLALSELMWGNKVLSSVSGALHYDLLVSRRQ